MTGAAWKAADSTISDVTWVSGSHLDSTPQDRHRHSLVVTMDRVTHTRDEVESATLPSLAAIKDSLAIAERLAQASLMTSPAAKRRLQARSVEMGRWDESGYVPPKDLLLYLVR